APAADQGLPRRAKRCVMAALPAHVYRRRRLVALAAVAGVVVAVVALAGLLGGGAPKVRSAAAPRKAQAAPPTQLPRGGRTIFPHFRIVAYYGAPQDPQLGEL